MLSEKAVSHRGTGNGGSRVAGFGLGGQVGGETSGEREEGGREGEGEGGREGRRRIRMENKSNGYFWMGASWMG